LILSMGMVLAYTTRRFERLLQRQAIDMRRIQRERIASLRSLVAGVCHELNNPLGALVSSAQVYERSLELLADPEKRERALAALTKIAAATDQATSRIQQTIGSLKSFARLDEAEVKVTKMEQMIDDALALLSTELESIAVEKQLADLAPITCRPGEINQVLMHLLRNAAQAGAKRIEIRAKTVPEGIQVEIEDDGRGISKEMLERIFDPTFSSEGGRVKMGFGLSASQSIVEDHGGWLAIDSVLGRGTTVRIVIRPNPTDGR
jgi:signal transduction histidine kinase